MQSNNSLHHAIKIERLTHDGRGVAHLNGKTVFVADTVPGDRVSLKITKQQDKFDEAEIITIENPSTERQEPFCPLYKKCGGCQLQHLNIEAQRHWKTQNFITQLTKAVNAKHCTTVAPLIGEDQGYRRRGRFGLAISKKDKQARLGFREKQSNDLIDIEHCPILTPALNQALQKQRPQLLELASRAYKEITMVEADNGVFTTKSSEQAAVNLEPSYELEDLTLHFPADGFVQVNRQQNKQMVKQAIDWLELDKKHNVLDLFCGVGNFTLPIAKQVKQIVGIEGLSELVDAAANNATNNNIDNSQFFKANLFEACEKLAWFREQKYHRVLLDPGRQGAFEICKKLHLLKADIIVYVSCNASTLIRDIKELEKQGYQLNKAGLIDMFPHTIHTEVMVQLKKTKPPKKKKANIFRF